MSFLAPFSALMIAAVAVPALVALYFLKLRRTQKAVSSTLLWRKAIEDMQVNAPFQRLRRNLLMWLQLAALAAMLFAFARPTLFGVAMQGQRAVILIDHSGSMNATDVSPSRLAAAQAMAIDLIDNLSAGGGAMVVSFAQSAQVQATFTGDRNELRRAVQQIAPTDQPGRLTSALTLIEPFALETAARGDQALIVYLISDGRFQDAHELSLRGAELRFINVRSAKPAENVGFIAAGARRDQQDPGMLQLFARLANYTSEPRRVNVTLRIDGQTHRVVPIVLPAGGDPDREPGSDVVQVALSMPGSGLISLSHDFDDHLAADNDVRLSIVPPTKLRVLIVGPGNPFLDHAVRAGGATDVAKRTGEQYEGLDASKLRDGGWGGGPIDVVIFDRFAPKELPPVHSLYFGVAPPIAGSALLPARSDGPRVQMMLDWDRRHPILEYVALDDVMLTMPGRLVLPPDGSVRTLASGTSGPLMASFDVAGMRHVTVGFDLMQSNWPMQVSFPVFIANAMQWLAMGEQQDAGRAFKPGDVVAVESLTGHDRVSYHGPESLAASASRQRAVLPMLRLAGLYRADRGATEPWTTIAVNMTDMIESDLRPAPELKLQAGNTQIAPTGSRAVQREVWRWFIWGAMALLMVEWIVYTQRMHL